MRTSLFVTTALLLTTVSVAWAQPPEGDPFPGLRQDFPQEPGEAPADEPFEPIDELVPFEENVPAEALPAHETEQEVTYHEAHVDAEEAAEEAHLREDDAHEDVEHGAHGHVTLGTVFSSIEFWGAVVNFGLLVFVLVLLGRKPLGNFLVGRRKGIEEGLAEAARLREAAQKRYEEYTDRLEKLDREIAEIRKEMIAAGEAERDRIVADAEAKAARMRREAEFLIEQQMKQLRVDLTREAVDAAVTAAEEVLRKGTSAGDQQRLAQQYVERLAEEAKA